MRGSRRWLAPSKVEFLGGGRKKLSTMMMIGLVFLAFSFCYSLIAFVYPEAVYHIHEYSPPKIFLELAGHFAFGFFASLPLVDIYLSLLAGSTAVLIDSDHLLAAANFNVNGRPDHSFLFAGISVVVLVLAARKLSPKRSTLIKIAFIGPMTLFSHLAFDIYAASSNIGASSFPLFVPYSFTDVLLGPSYWILFEGLAALTAVIGYIVAHWIISSASRREGDTEGRKRSQESKNEQPGSRKAQTPPLT